MKFIDVNKQRIEVSNARVASLRWDLIPWSLVFDLDFKSEESTGAALARAWMIFEGVSDLRLPINDARLPVGFWIDRISIEKIHVEFFKYTVGAQIPTFKDENLPIFPSPQSLSVIATACKFLISEATSQSNKYQFLDYEMRINLAADSQMLAAYRSLSQKVR